MASLKHFAAPIVVTFTSLCSGPPVILALLRQYKKLYFTQDPGLRTSNRIVLLMLLLVAVLFLFLAMATYQGVVRMILSAPS